MNSPRTEVRGESPFGDSEKAEIRAAAERLLASAPLAGSVRKAQLLRYLLDHALAGQEVTEYGIGLDIFEKPVSFDPRIDSAVRAEVSRLRQKLKEYYLAAGRTERVVIDFPQRSYLPSFTFRQPEKLTPKRLRWEIAAALALAAGAGILGLWKYFPTQSVDSIVILPFANLSAEGQNDYLADGLTEELTNELAQRPDLRVVARTSAFQFKGKAIDVREIGRRLNVDAVLEGSFVKLGDRIRVTAQLNRTATGYHLWSHAFEARSADMMSLQDEMARSIAAAIRGVGRRQPAPPLPGLTTNPDAHDLFLQANYQFALRTPDSTRKSLDLFKAAVDRDPSYVAAYRGIARAETALIHFTTEAPRPAFDRVRQALEKALEINPRDPETLGQIADIDYVDDWDWPRAEREFRLAVEQGAGATTRSYFGWALATRGRFVESHRQLQIAQDLDPLNAGPRFNQMIAFMLERRFAEAKQVLHQMLDAQLSGLDAHLMLGVIAIYERDCNEAETQFESAAKTYSAPVTTFGLALAAGCRDEREQARRLLDKTSATPGFVSPYQLAMGYAYLHDPDRALPFLNQSAAAREGQIFYLKLDPIFDGIRSDPRFVALEKQIGLEP